MEYKAMFTEDEIGDIVFLVREGYTHNEFKAGIIEGNKRVKSKLHRSTKFIQGEWQTTDEKTMSGINMFVN